MSEGSTGANRLIAFGMRAGISESLLPQIGKKAIWGRFGILGGG